MSAIFGIYYLDGRPVDPTSLEEMSNILAHRGSDGGGIWHKDSIGFGHRMLWTTPESVQERLPKTSPQANLAITADARLDNRNELLSLLGRSGVGETISDSDIILWSYEKWGKHCVERLLGDFAFAIWDGRTRSVFCARDHFGVKSLNYYVSESTFIFASEVKAIFATHEVVRSLNEPKVIDHLEGQFDDVSSTFYKNIFKLPARSSMTVHRTGIVLDTYWTPQVGPEIRLKSNEEYADQFREIFFEAVRCRMRSNSSVGSMLSGGLDSSSITCAARILNSRAENGDLPTFSSIFNTVKEADEKHFIDAVLAAGGISPSFLEADRLSPFTQWEKMSWHLDEPLFSCNQYMLWGMYEMASEKGVRVILDGFDGDTTVSHGLAYFQELAADKRWFALAKEIRPFSKNYHHKPLRLFWEYFNNYRVQPALAAFAPTRVAKRKGRALLRKTFGIPSRPQARFRMDSILNPDFVSDADLMNRRQEFRARQVIPITQKDDHLLKVKNGVLPYILEVVDKSASAFGLEARFPFWDRRLVDFCLSIPPQQKVQNGWTRFILRNSMNDVLPRAIQWRGAKTKLGPAFVECLSKYEVDRINYLFEDKSGAINRFVRTDLLRDSIPALSLGTRPTSDESVYIWRTLSLSLWLEREALAI